MSSGYGNKNSKYLVCTDLKRCHAYIISYFKDFKKIWDVTYFRCIVFFLIIEYDCEVWTPWLHRWSAIAASLPGRTDNEIKNFWHTHLKKRIQKSGVHNGNPSSRILQEAQANTSSNASSVMIANYGLPSRNINPPIAGFYGAVSSDTFGEIKDNHGSCQLSEEMEFWYNIFIKSGQTSWDNWYLGYYIARLHDTSIKFVSLLNFFVFRWQLTFGFSLVFVSKT